MEGALEGALSGLGAVLSGKKSLDGTLQEMGKGLERLGQSCESKLFSAVCHTSCWMAGMELQRTMWWCAAPCSPIVTTDDTSSTHRPLPQA